MTYEDLINKIKNDVPFSFSRWGDGEFNAMLGVKGRNCDKHEYFPDMGAALVDVLDYQRDGQEYYLGLQNLAKRVNKDNPAFDELTEGLEWINADIIHNHSIKNNGVDSLFKALEGKNVTLVGGIHLMEIADARGWRFIDIPQKNCWSQYKETRKRVGALPISNDVILYCASMMSNVLIDGLSKYSVPHGWLTQIDIGSAFDPYVGRLSRQYHKKLDL
jgi:hypothetical protein